MPKNAREVANSLKQKGFVEKPNNHMRYMLYVGGRKTPIYTRKGGEKKYATRY